MTPSFSLVYWGEDKSTRVQFEPTVTLPAGPISACMVFALYDGKLAMSYPKRGWGLPGGHMEQAETPEECIRREAVEEAAIELGELRLIGQWKAAKQFDSEFNRYYPDTAYQLLYVSEVVKVHDFVPQFEVSQRAFVALDDVMDFHHDPVQFREIFEYAVGLGKS